MVSGAGSLDSSNLMNYESLDIPLIRRPLLRLLLSRAREYRLLREEVSSLYTYGYGLFRNYFIELGRRLVERGSLDKVEDIFYLYYEEVRGLFDGSFDGNSDPKLLVDKRRREMEESRDINLPTNIFGENPPPIHRDKIEELRGVPTSRGYYTGPARLIHGTGDFGRLREGDVIVIPYSDIGWTPLFARAGAVIAESGGILSHSSIVAREYGIPAVVSVDGAMQLKDGQVVSVDGFTGAVTLHDESHTNPGISK
jgi:pyruvate,water dikinase